jgi:NADH-ubiquinone oxidoreductase chain 2
MGWPQIKKNIPFISSLNNSAIEVKEEIQNKGDSYSTDYSLIVLFSSLGSALLISSYDLISLYLSIELQSFGLYVLSTLYRDSESSTAAGLKYFLLGGLSSCIILLGAGIIYSYTGITNFESLYLINSISDINQQYIIQGLSLGLILIFVGFLFKIAAAPLHNWSPDVYDGTPTIVTTWLTIIPKISILIILLELQTQLGIIGGTIGETLIISNTGYISNILNLPLNVIEGILNLNVQNLAFINDNIISSSSYILGLPVIKNLLLISSFLSLIIGSLLGLAQTKIGHQMYMMGHPQ